MSCYIPCCIFLQDKSTLSEDKLEGLEQILGEEADAKAILKAARASMGMDTSEQDMENIHIFTERMVSLAKYRKEVSMCSISAYVCHVVK